MASTSLAASSELRGNHVELREGITGTPLWMAAVGGDGGSVFEDQVRGPGYLVGFRHTAGSYYEYTIVQSLEPVYRTPKGLCGGSVHGNDRNRPAGAHETIAKTGYAVGALVMKGGMVLDGFKIIFMRVKGDFLDPRDRYESEWIGGPGGGPEITQGGRGRQIVGIHGRDGLMIDALGLIERTPQAASPLAEVPALDHIGWPNRGSQSARTIHEQVTAPTSLGCSNTFAGATPSARGGLAPHGAAWNSPG